MKWTYLPVRQSYWREKKYLLLLLTALLCSCAGRFLPALSQARQLLGQTYLMSGRVLSSQGRQAVIRQKYGVKVLLQTDGPLEAGSLVQGRVLAQELTGQLNPGGFSEKNWALGQGILYKARPVQQLTQKKGPGLGQTIRSARSGLQDLLSQALLANLPKEEAGLLAALLLGNKTGLDKQLTFAFNQAGLAHLMAVSGLHLGCLLLPARRLLEKLKVPAPRRYLYLVLGLFAWAGLLGWPTALGRAVIMTSLPLLGKFFLRTSSNIYCLGLAFCLLLLINPFLLCQFAFWLSFSATAGVLLLARPLAARLASWLKFLPDSLCGAIAVSLAAQLATAPLLLGWGKSISLLSVIFNIPAGFLTSLILWLGLAFLPLALVSLAWPWLLPGFCSWPLARLLRLFSQLAAWLARQRAGRIFRLEAVFICLAVLLLLYFLAGKKTGPRPVWLWLGLLLSFIFLLGQLGGRMLQAPVQVYFLDVGQGDATLIRPRWGKSILIDGGRPGQGREVLLPALDYLGIRRPGLVIASHGHQDHVGGLVELADYGLVQNLLLPAGLAQNLAPDDAELAKLLRLIKPPASLLQEGSARDTIAFNKNVQLQILAPEKSPRLVEEARLDGNAWSFVLLASFGQGRLLLTGDCTRPQEQRLAWPPADVLHVAHHGSAATTGPLMLDQVRPGLAVISVGPNSYGHPAPAVLQNLAEIDCRVYRTDRAGAVVLGFYKDKITCYTYAGD